MTKLIKMQRDGHVVDVHPEMVEDYRAGGYSEIEEANAPKRGRKPKSEG